MKTTLRKHILILIILIFNSINSFSQKVIKMEKENGVYFIPCKVNGVPMKFIFDTGASDVSISLTEAQFLAKNGLLESEDIKGTVKYQIANGDIQEGTKIIIREINIDGIILKNIEASIVHESNSPLLLGQSAISKLGSIQLNGDELIINSDNSIFLNVDFKKHFNYYGFKANLHDLPKNEEIVRVDLHLLSSKKHFLEGLNFREEAIFNRKGNLTGIVLKKEPKNVELEFSKLFNLLTEKYGNYTEYGKTSISWKRKYYEINIIRKENQLAIVCIGNSLVKNEEISNHTNNKYSSFLNIDFNKIYQDFNYEKDFVQFKSDARKLSKIKKSGEISTEKFFNKNHSLNHLNFTREWFTFNTNGTIHSVYLVKKTTKKNSHNDFLKVTEELLNILGEFKIIDSNSIFWGNEKSRYVVYLYNFEHSIMITCVNFKNL